MRIRQTQEEAKAVLAKLQELEAAMPGKNYKDLFPLAQEALPTERRRRSICGRSKLMELANGSGPSTPPPARKPAKAAAIIPATTSGMDRIASALEGLVEALMDEALDKLAIKIEANRQRRIELIRERATAAKIE